MSFWHNDTKSELRNQNYELNQNKSRNKNKKLSRFLPTSLMSAIYSDKKKLGQLKTKLAKLSAKEIDVKAGIISLSACQDKQVALEGENYGLFTESLLKIINSNQNPKRGQKPKRLTASYLITEVKKLLKGKQIPIYSKLGNIPRTFLMESIF